jgi:excisionase family DNA binding protein
MKSRRTEIKDNEIVMTAEEVAAFLKVRATTVRKWTREGELKGSKLGGKGDWRYLRTNVLKFLMSSSRRAHSN